MKMNNKPTRNLHQSYGDSNRAGDLPRPTIDVASPSDSKVMTAEFVFKALKCKNWTSKMRIWLQCHDISFQSHFHGAWNSFTEHWQFVQCQAPREPPPASKSPLSRMLPASELSKMLPPLMLSRIVLDSTLAWTNRGEARKTMTPVFISKILKNVCCPQGPPSLFS